MEWFQINLDQSLFFKSNFSLFRKQYPELAERIFPDKEKLTHYEFAQEGEIFYCRDTRTGLNFYPLDSLASHQKSVYSNALKFFKRGAELLFFCGIGLGYVSTEIEHQIRNESQKGIVLLENRPELILAKLGLFDCTELINAESVFWVLGENFWEELRQLILKERLYVVPVEKIATLPERELTVAEKAEFRKIISWFHQFKHNIRNEVIQNRVQFTVKMDQPSNLDNGTIWAVTVAGAYAHTPLMSALMDGFVEIGWTKKIFTLRSEFSAWYRVYEDLVECAPDLLLVCNTASSVYFKEDVRRPRLVWMLDNPRYFASSLMREELTENDHLLYIDRTFASSFDKTTIGSSGFIPANAMISHRGIVREEMRAPLMFVGSYTNLEIYLYKISNSMREEIFYLLEHLITHSLHNTPQLIESLGIREETIQALHIRASTYIANLRRPFPDSKLELEYFLYALSNSYKREKIIRALLDLGLVIYGPDSWLPFLGERHREQYRNWLAADDLPDAYASADICLNIHSLQCPTCLNPRDFDVLAAGGLLLTDWVEDLGKGIITPDKDCVAFHNVEELRTKVKELLANPEKRTIISAQGHQTYLEHHTPKHRAAQILKQIRQ